MHTGRLRVAADSTLQFMKFRSCWVKVLKKKVTNKQSETDLVFPQKLIFAQGQIPQVSQQDSSMAAVTNKKLSNRHHHMRTGWKKQAQLNLSSTSKQNLSPRCKYIALLCYTVPDFPESSNRCHRVPHLNVIGLKEAQEGLKQENNTLCKAFIQDGHAHIQIWHFYNNFVLQSPCSDQHLHLYLCQKIIIIVIYHLADYV